MSNQLKKALDISKKTGDRIIVFDSAQENNEHVYVITPLDDYEKLVKNREAVKSLTEDELIDKINRDIAIWKSQQDLFGDFDKDETNEDYPDFNNRYNNDFVDINEVLPSVQERIKQKQEEDFQKKDFFTPSLENFSAKKKKSSWKIPSDRKEAAEEIIEEDRQYLEDVDY